jgi:hypothetical protein
MPVMTLEGVLNNKLANPFAIEGYPCGQGRIIALALNWSVQVVAYSLCIPSDFLR